MESVEISSKGSAADHHAASLGTYVKTNQLSQGYPVYQKDEEGENYFLFVGPYGNWIVAPDLKQVHLAVLKNSVAKPTAKIPPRLSWLFLHTSAEFRNSKDKEDLRSCKWLEDNTIEAVAKVDGELSGNTPVDRFLIKCGLEKYIPSFAELEVTMKDLQRSHRGIAYYPDASPGGECYEITQRNIFKCYDVSLDECLIMRKIMWEDDEPLRTGMMQNEQDDASEDTLPFFPYNTATVNHGKPVTAVTFFGGFLFTGGVGGSVRLWNTHPSRDPPFTHPLLRYDPDPSSSYSKSPHSRKFSTPIMEFTLGGSDSVFEKQTESVVTCIKPVEGRAPGLIVGGLFQERKSIQYIVYNNHFPPTNQQFCEMGSFAKKCLDLALSPDYKLLYCCHSTYNNILKEDSNVEIWDMTEGEQVGLLQGHEAGVTSIAISEDGTRLWTGGLDKTVRLWDLETKTQLQKYELGEEVTGLTCSPREPRVDLAVACTGSPGVSVMRAGSEDVERIEMDTRGKIPVFSPSGDWFLTTGRGVSGCVAPTGPKLFTLHSDAEATCGAFHPEGSFIALGTTNENAEDKYRVEILNVSKSGVATGYDSD